MAGTTIPRLPEFLDRDFLGVFPTSLTVIPTYRCTAACEQCCFESSPKRRGRLTLETIKARISEAHATFPALRLVVFSGGEVLLLKRDLFAAVAHAHSFGLMTRIVTNGYWGRSASRARSVVGELRDAGLAEINFSTGLDHQRWVPMDSVVQAADAAAAAGLITLVTVEQDARDSRCMSDLLADDRIKRLLREPNFRLQANSWMPFHADAEPRETLVDRRDLQSGCSQVFNNLVVTPYDQFAGCCGLTFEHIPEMKLGQLGESSMAAMYEDQLSDFLKAWIHVDGPHRIMTRLFGTEAEEALQEVNHICQACVIMHQHPGVRAALKARFAEFVPEVMARLNARVRLLARERAAAGVNPVNTTMMQEAAT